MWDEIAELLTEDERRNDLIWDEYLRRQAADTALYERYMLAHDAAHEDYRLTDEGE